MVKETAGFRIQCLQGCHFCRAKFEIKHTDIFDHPFPASRFGERNDASLYDPAKNDLSNTFVVCGGDR